MSPSSMIRSIALLPMMLALVCCSMSSENPVSSIEESAPIPDYLVGIWHFAEIVGLDASEKEAEIVLSRNDDGSLKVTMHEEGEILEWNASLANVGGLTVVSNEPLGFGSTWVIVSVSFDEENQELNILSLSEEDVIEDVRQGIVAGTVEESDERESAALTATSAELRSYLEQHGDRFTVPYAILKKQSQ